MLRSFQSDLYNRSHERWDAGVNNIGLVTATGSGKTVIMSHHAARYAGEPGIAMAHRSVLVGQISMALASQGVPHDIIAPQAVVRTVVNEQLKEFGRQFYNPQAPWKVASVDTMPGRADRYERWIRSVKWGMMDEAHHVLRDNKWGREVLRFPETARWLFPTATPERGDRKGLGRHADGLIDELVVGPPMRWLISQGYLTDYQIRAPMPADLDLSDVEVSSGGDYNQKQLRKAVHRSKKIIGSVVGTYTQFTPNMLGIVFAVDIQHAEELVSGFQAAGVPCELITADHSEEERRAILKRYKDRQTMVLVNVDLFGEGFDLPAIEVVMFARPTNSFSLFAQQFGRGLRLMIDRTAAAAWEMYSPQTRLELIARSPKPIAHIHDHVGNVLHFFGPPDREREWTLDRTKGARSGSSDAIPLRVCLNPMCNAPYERFMPRCPYCGTEPPPPPEPKLPEEVDGDLTLYTPEMLQRMFGVSTVEQALAIKPNDTLLVPHGAKPEVVGALRKHHNHKLQQQYELAKLMPVVMPPTLSDRENQRRFYLRYGVDVVQAKLLGGKETEELVGKILDSVKRSKVPSR